jgi:hypothetical protein
MVKPVLTGHPRDKETVVFKDRYPLTRGSSHMQFSMTEQYKCDL